MGTLSNLIQGKKTSGKAVTTPYIGTSVAFPNRTSVADVAGRLGRHMAVVETYTADPLGQAISSLKPTKWKADTAAKRGWLSSMLITFPQVAYIAPLQNAYRLTKETATMAVLAGPTGAAIIKKASMPDTWDIVDIVYSNRSLIGGAGESIVDFTESVKEGATGFVDYVAEKAESPIKTAIMSYAAAAAVVGIVAIIWMTD